MLRGAIIGLGSMGQNHLACYKSVENAEIVAVCDTRPGHASTTIKNWGLDIPAYEDMVGSPVLFPSWALPELMNLPEGKGGGAVIKNHPNEVCCVY